MFVLVSISVLTLLTCIESSPEFDHRGDIISKYQPRHQLRVQSPVSFQHRDLYQVDPSRKNSIPFNPATSENLPGHPGVPQHSADLPVRSARITNNNNRPAVVVIENAPRPYPPHSNVPVPSDSNVQPRYPVASADTYHQQRHNFTAIDNFDHQTSASDGWGWPQLQQHHHHHHGGGWGWKGGDNKGYDFRPYFDIALTALGLLSLGTFLLNMLLNALLFSGLVTSTGTGTGIITTTTTGGTTGTGTGTGTGGVITVTTTGTGTGTGITTTGTGFFKKRVGEIEDDEAEQGRSFGFTSIQDCFNASNFHDSEARTPRRRHRRETMELFLDPATSMNAMAHSVLQGVDAMMYKKECLGKVYCEGNRHAKVVGKGFQFLMPLYSISASYLGKKFGWHEDMGDHMKGVALGVGESNCETHFPQC